MKRLFFILLIFISASINAQNCPKNSVFVDMKFFKVCYSEVYKNPISVTYKLYKPKSLVERGSMDFHKQDGIKTASDLDYRDNVYDKGHLAPAETFSNSKESLYSSFSYVNCAVQHYKLNRGVWKSLEEHERQWAQQDSLLVINRVIFNKPLHPMKSGAYIPDYFEKTIINLRTKVKRTFRFPNVEPVSKDYTYYEVKKK